MAKGKYRRRRQAAEGDGPQRPERETPETPERSEAPEEETTWSIESSDYKKEGEVGLDDLTRLDFERQAAYAAAGKEEPVYGVWGHLWKLLRPLMKERQKHTVKKSTYMLLLVFTGWIGGHRYYERRWILGMIYTAFCWTGVPLACCVIDAMIAIPIKKDEDGFIQI